MSELACILRDDRRFRPIILLATEKMFQLRPEVENLGLEVVDLSLQFERRLKKPTRILESCHRKILRARDRQTLSFSFWDDLRRLILMLWLYAAWGRLSRQALKQLRPSVMMIPGDRELAPVAPFLRECRNEGLPSVVCVSYVPDNEPLKYSRSNDPEFRAGPSSRVLNRLTAWLFPSQLYGKDDLILFSPGWRVLAMKVLGMASSNPWVQGGGFSDFVIHSNEIYLQIVLSQGLSEPKAILAGDHTLDKLYRTYNRKDEVRSTLSRSYGLRKDCKLVIVAVPNDAEHGLCDMKTHKRRLENWLRHLRERNYDVLISLHPKSIRSDYDWLSDCFGFQFSNQRLVQILPAADLFIHGESSTEDWAELCGIPAINMEFMLLSNRDIRKRSCLVATTETNFKKILDGFDLGKGFENLENCSERWRSQTLFDGQSSQRLLNFLATLSK